jgi:hypothetical protein
MFTNRPPVDPAVLFTGNLKPRQASRYCCECIGRRHCDLSEHVCSVPSLRRRCVRVQQL